MTGFFCLEQANSANIFHHYWTWTKRQKELLVTVEMPQNSLLIQAGPAEGVLAWQHFGLLELLSTDRAMQELFFKWRVRCQLVHCHGNPFVSIQEAGRKLQMCYPKSAEKKNLLLSNHKSLTGTFHGGARRSQFEQASAWMFADVSAGWAGRTRGLGTHGLWPQNFAKLCTFQQNPQPKHEVLKSGLFWRKESEIGPSRPDFRFSVLVSHPTVPNSNPMHPSRMVTVTGRLILTLPGIANSHTFLLQKLYCWKDFTLYSLQWRGHLRST